MEDGFEFDRCRKEMNKGLVPGFSDYRLLKLMRAAVHQCQLDLSKDIVLTEAASGAYVVTPVLAALANARRVFALTKPSSYGTVKDVSARTQHLADLTGVSDRIEIITEKSGEVVRQADIITNSGHVRPIHAEMISRMKDTAVIPLMYEAWEFRPGDIDLQVCKSRGIPVVGTNERHPAVDAFSYLGPLAVKLLFDAGLSVYGNRILLLCDNSFSSYIENGLKNCGAWVDVLQEAPIASPQNQYDAVLVAMTPTPIPILGPKNLDRLTDFFRETILVQFWSDLDREVLRERGIPFWPPKAPKRGHMGIGMSDTGPEAVVRLQAAGLKVGQIMANERRENPRLESCEMAVKAAIDSGFGQALKMDTHL